MMMSLMAKSAAFACLVMVLVVVSVHADTCPTTFQCIGLGGDCSNTIATTEKTCSTGLFANTTTGGTTCNCAKKGTYTLGQSCTADQSWDNHVCMSDPINGINDNRWYSVKRIGDTCAAGNNFDCYPPRVCSSGTCQGNLMINSTCWNQTASSQPNYFGLCPSNAYCQTWSLQIGILVGVAQCVPLRQQGQRCPYTDTNSADGRSVCANGLSCVGASSGVAGICGTQPVAFVDGGVMANSSVECKSQTWNFTTQICLDYTTMYNLAQSKKGADCTQDSDCGLATALPPIASCQCNGAGSANKKTCSGYSLPSPSNAVSQWAQIDSSNKNLAAANCETLEVFLDLADEEPATSNTCSKLDYNPGIAASCAYLKTYVDAGVPDCDGSYAAMCGGALHTMSVSFGAVVALIISSFAAAAL